MKKLFIIFIIVFILGFMISCVDRPNHEISKSEQINYSLEEILNVINQKIENNDFSNSSSLVEKTDYPVAYMSSNVNDKLYTNKIVFNGNEYFSMDDIQKDNNLTINEKSKLSKMFNSVFGIDYNELNVKTFMEALFKLTYLN